MEHAHTHEPHETDRDAAVGKHEALTASFVDRAYPAWIVSATTEIGKRKTQEDRFIVCPRLGADHIAFFGVFDGTVGDFASDFVHRHIVQQCVRTKDFQRLLRMDAAAAATVDVGRIAGDALTETFNNTDAALLRAVQGRKELDYTSSTGVVALLAHGVLTVAHVGDSKIVLGSMHRGIMHASCLTVDHKPDMPDELRRIESQGGSLTFLHGGKPFIRGGDFARRQELGDRPMQLNYSRAFGGKDLKVFGLAVEPDVSTLELTTADKVLILASDGVWDVLTPDAAVQLVMKAAAQRRCPSRVLVTCACELHVRRRSADNVTAIVVFFTPDAPNGAAISSASAPIPAAVPGAAAAAAGSSGAELGAAAGAAVGAHSAAAAAPGALQPSKPRRHGSDGAASTGGLAKGSEKATPPRGKPKPVDAPRRRPSGGSVPEGGHDAHASALDVLVSGKGSGSGRRLARQPSSS